MTAHSYSLHDVEASAVPTYLGQYLGKTGHGEHWCYPEAGAKAPPAGQKSGQTSRGVAPFVVVSHACDVLRLACVRDHAGDLRYMPVGGSPARFDTVADAGSAIASTCQRLRLDPAGYEVVGLAAWEDEKLARGRRRKKAASP